MLLSARCSEELHVHVLLEYVIISEKKIDSSVQQAALNASCCETTKDLVFKDRTVLFQV